MIRMCGWHKLYWNTHKFMGFRGPLSSNFAVDRKFPFIHPIITHGMCELCQAQWRLLDQKKQEDYFGPVRHQKKKTWK